MKVENVQPQIDFLLADSAGALNVHGFLYLFQV